MELDGFIHVLLLCVNRCDLNVTVANLLRLGAESHFEELPGLTKHVEGPLVVTLTQVDLGDDLEDLAI